MAYTLNRNGTYTGGKRNPLSFDESFITDKSQQTQKPANQHFFRFKTNGRKCDLECPIHGIINSCEIKGAYLGRVLSIFWPKKLHNDFFWKNILVNLKDEYSPVLLSLFSDCLLFYVSWKIDIILADQSELWTRVLLIKNQKWDPLRAMKTFIRRKVGQTT